ncbi:Rieske 2Fe-2S domain-containing protein [Advenella incenata]|uniref:Rieske (2Fe-2S) protein n=1 Tax=Advenella incenata TaxID=267800 RepID=UPI0010289A6E
MNDFLRVLDEVDLPVGTNRAIEVFGRSVLLCRTAEGVFAVANECTHQKMPLEGGRMRGCYLFCPTHGVRFDLRSGTPTGNLTTTPLRCFDVRVSNGGIEIAHKSLD